MRKNYNWKRIKDPETGKWIWPTEPHRIRKLPLHKYIESRTRVDPITGCWVWMNKKHGFASTATHSSSQRRGSVGQVSWWCYFGEIPKGYYICHECDNGHCANPMHLFLGTQKDNMRDCVNKRRHLHGERHPKSKLTEEKVLKIREMRAAGATYEAIGKAFGIAMITAWSTANRKNWKHI